MHFTSPGHYVYQVLRHNAKYYSLPLTINIRTEPKALFSHSLITVSSQQLTTGLPVSKEQAVHWAVWTHLPGINKKHS
jgi:hypothetical protein